MARVSLEAWVGTLRFDQPLRNFAGIAGLIRDKYQRLIFWPSSQPPQGSIKLICRKFQRDPRYSQAYLRERPPSGFEFVNSLFDPSLAVCLRSPPSIVPGSTAPTVPQCSP